jgi:ribosomal protein S12 methylthiotransferase
LRTKSQKKKINIVSLGCSKNLVDSEVLMGQLRANEMQVTFEEESEKADAVVINTCGFIADAKQESIDTILQYVKAKKDGLIEDVYVMGCLSERYKKDLENEIPDVDQYFGVNDINQIVKKLGGDYKKELLGERKLTTPPHYAYLKIAEGCNRRCTFCAIPGIRGKHVSRPIEEIISEAEYIVRRGVKEIILISQDLTYYGIDLYKKNRLADLIKGIADIEGLEWLRLHYTYPAGFPEDILEIIASHPNICEYIDMPVQHINNRILQLMQRGHSKEQTLDLLRKIRTQLPNAALRTTLIVGFPGETEEEFEELVDFISEFKFDRLGVFTYSPEDDTKAFQMPDNVPEEVKQERLEMLMDIQQNISLELNQAKEGKVFKVLIDRLEGKNYIGRTEYDSPEVDNEVLVTAKGKFLKPGNYYNVEITGADFFDLSGKII